MSAVRTLKPARPTLADLVRLSDAVELSYQHSTGLYVASLRTSTGEDLTFGAHTIETAIEGLIRAQARHEMAMPAPLPECSICRRRHGSEVQHACE